MTSTPSPTDTDDPTAVPTAGDDDSADDADSDADDEVSDALENAVDKAQAAVDAAQTVKDGATDDYDAARTAYRSAKALDASTTKISASATKAAKAAAAAFLVALQQGHSDSTTTTLGALLDDGPSGGNLLQRLTAANQLGSMHGPLATLAARAASTAKHADAARAAATQAHAALEAIPLAEKSAAKKAAASAVDAAQSALDAATDAMLAESDGDTDTDFIDDFGLDSGVQTDPGPDDSGGGFTPNATQVAGAIAFAEAQLGKPYATDGAGPDSWDCSGLTKAAYLAAGIDIGAHFVPAQLSVMRSEGRLLPFNDRERGDLIFWQGDDGSFPHVAIYLGHNMILAAPQLGESVTIEPMWTSATEHLYDLVGRPSGTP
ncbi:C40 family peptidase [Humibacter ginsenosidimutans]|uniref:NlpC/P60 family protein n=1 Tax=Humibacter ginsenosidimutans TaxID=2599293 RepID=A0A5B8LYI2_9MICO|nr:NlpC/P60 family protein [Humibacter ginsenosidimutans]QDZ13578.1 NlpC/P60 family protein [Humibacter ginsenosidimutans]